MKNDKLKKLFMVIYRRVKGSGRGFVAATAGAIKRSIRNLT